MVKEIEKHSLDEREFELINILGDDLAINQRDLSRHMDLSLGTVNMLIRRLVTKGYIRIRQLNKRKVEYILTPKGFAEKTRKSIKYTLKTLNSIASVKESMKPIIIRLYEKGERNFFVLGESDLAFLVESVLRENGLNDYKISYLKELPQAELRGTLLICKENSENGPYNIKNRIDLVKELAQSNSFMLQDKQAMN